MAGNDTSKAQPEQQAPQSGKPGARVASIAIATVAGGVLGHVFGRLGDTHKRNLAQYTFAGLGAVFGGLLSFFATKRVAQPTQAAEEPQYYFVGSPGGPEQRAPQPETTVEGAAHAGRIDPSLVRSVAR